MKKSKIKRTDQMPSDDPLANDLTEKILRSELVPASLIFEYLPNDAAISLRLPSKLLATVKKVTKNKDIQKFIRQAVMEKLKKEDS